MAAMTTMTEEPTRPAPLVRTEMHGSGLALVTIDDPQAPHNTITPAFAAALCDELDALEQSPKVNAIVVRSGKADSFLVGANIEFVRALRFAKDAEDVSREIATRLARIARSKKPIVACAHGPVLGGGFELTLACTATVASDDPKTVFGLPEVKLGLVPAGNGLLRIAQRAGLRTAIDLGLSGRNVRAEAALALGLCDEVVSESILLDTACELALRLASRPELRKSLPRKRHQRATRADASGLPKNSLSALATRALLERNPIGRSVLFKRARETAVARTRGHYPATAHVLDILERFGSRGFRSAATLEARLFGELVVSETAHRSIELFFAETALKKDTGLAPGEHASARSIERVGVFGAGLMGAGIAAVTVQAGIPTRMKDRDDAHLGRGLRYVKEVLDARVRRGAMSALERDKAFGALEGTIDPSGFRRADVVIEAVFEDIDLKREIVRTIEELVSESCVIASNTASLPIAKIAAAASRPERIVGMHYARPVPNVRLVEVVRTKQTDPNALATAVALAKRQGKTVIVVNDGYGFYTTRALIPFFGEALRLVAEGVAIENIDDALVDWGFPKGPLLLLDELGIDLAEHFANAAHVAFGDRMRPPAVFGELARDDRRGRKNGRGFYMHRTGSRSGAPIRVDDTIYSTLLTMPRKKPMPEEIQLRCALAMLNEAFRCLDEGVLRSARDGDLGAVLALGFPAFRGGPFRYVDVLGANEVLRRTRSLEQRFGARFEPAPLLVDMARHGKRSYG